ncbi:MAG TPA: CDP-glycerol glycerophosphotransferase family protein [Bacteroidia bacterium]|nr:CDP-glycerol glycerophosphotransferase family protein [Bacteroidia bacterium]
MLKELKEIALKAPVLKTNKYLATRKNKFDIAYSLLYPNFKLFVLNKNIFELLLHSFIKTFKIPSSTSIEFNLSDELQLFKPSLLLNEMQTSIVIRKTIKKDIILHVIKNAYYALTQLLHKFKFYKSVKSNTPHALLFIYDTANDINLFKHFVERVAKQDKIKLSIIQISSGIAQEYVFDVASLKFNTSIDIYYLKKFKAFVSAKNASFFNWAESINPDYTIFKDFGITQNLEIYYSFVAEAIKKIKPTITLYDNTGEVGRVVSDISRQFKIPSVNIEYAQFTDDAIHMESNIKFSARACLGYASAQLWKKRNDPTPVHVPIGFLKLDSLKNTIYDKAFFFTKHGLDISKATIFFASTWSAINDIYNEEKAKIIEELCEICKKNDWNLIIKKHPSERDRFANDAAKKTTYTRVKVFEHVEIDLYEAIFFCDIVTTQFSGVSIEALYFKKPVLFINMSNNNNWASLSIMKDEPYVFMYNDFILIEEKINKLLREKNSFTELMNMDIKKYLYSDDGQASERLIELIQKTKE